MDDFCKHMLESDERVKQFYDKASMIADKATTNELMILEEICHAELAKRGYYDL